MRAISHACQCGVLVSYGKFNSVKKGGLIIRLSGPARNEEFSPVEVEELQMAWVREGVAWIDLACFGRKCEERIVGTGICWWQRHYGRLCRRVNETLV